MGSLHSTGLISSTILVRDRKSISKNTLTSLRRSLESWSYTSFHPGTTFLPAEEVDFFLQNYLIQAGLEETKSREEIKLEFEIHLTYVVLCKSKNSVFTKKSQT